MPDPGPDPALRIAQLEAELRDARARLAVRTDEARSNEDRYRRLQARELELIRLESLPEFLAAVVPLLVAGYRVETGALAVSDPQHEIRHLLLGDGRRLDQLPDVIFCDSPSALLPEVFLRPGRPWLGPYVTADHQLLFAGASGLGSIAILPLARGERLLGALGFGSPEPKRYTRGHATDFLAHLAAIVGFCLENAVNRARLARAGLTDYLTGWHNKRYLHLRLREEMARAQRSGTAVALLMIDLDHFKQVNDSVGHLGGDAAIREVAARVDAQIRQSDAAARFGGDEFAVLLPGTGAGAALQLASRIRAAVGAAPVDLGNGDSRQLTLSIGVAALAPGCDADLKALADRLLAEADAALYRAKSLGRDRVEVHG